jgi:uncharacterized delta-60 repeat protein
MSLRPRRSRLALVLAMSSAALLLLPGTHAMAAPGDLDAGFDTDGIVTTNVGTVDQAFDVAVDSSDRVIVAGFTYNSHDRDFAVVRYKADGSLDTSFSGDGKVATDLGGLSGNEQINAVAVQGDDKIVVAGNTVGVDQDMAVARYNTDGTLDTSFSGDGYLTTDFVGDDSAQGVAIDDSGDIVVAGSAHVGGDVDFALARYTSGGVPDASFDGDGMLTTAVGPSNDQANDVGIDSHGEIVAVGATTQGAHNKDFAIVRYNDDGSLDDTFSSDGIVIPNGTDKARSVAIDGADNIVAAGSYYNIQSHDLDFGIVRYTPDGLPDGTFGSEGNGRVNTPVGKGGEALSVAIDGQGRIVAAGYASNGTDRDFALVLYDASGNPETTFGTGGKVLTPIGTNDSGRGVAVDSLGRFVMGGYALTGRNADFAAVRFLTAGYRPDAMIRVGTKGAYVGGDVYNASGKGQVALARAKAGRTAQLGLRLQNDGTGQDSLAVAGCGSLSGFAVKYFTGGTDVTQQVIAGTYTAGPLQIGSSSALTMSVNIRRKAVGKTYSCKITTTSTTATAEADAVVAKVKGLAA